LVVGTPLLFLGLIELVLALFELPRDSDDPNFGEMVRRIDAEEFFYEVDPELFWRLAPSMTVRGEATSFHTNAHGFRGPELPALGGDAVVILAMGDSVTFGYGLADAETYPALLQAGLANRWPGRSVRVVNAGVPGYTTHQGRVALPDLLRRLDPEVVILCYGFNDARNLFASDAEVARVGRLAQAARRVLWKSRLYRGLRTLLIAPPRLEDADGRPQVARVDLDSYRANLAAMVDDVRRAGSTPVLVGTPFQLDTRTPYGPSWFSLHTPVARYRATARDVALEASVPFVNVAPLTEPHAADNEPLFLDPAHPSPAGTRILVDSLLTVFDGPVPGDGLVP
jgi:lysophospholipase L1-like esterase